MDFKVIYRILDCSRPYADSCMAGNDTTFQVGVKEQAQGCLR